MPINLFNNPLSSIKLGADDILKGYIGNGQVFPNSAEITAAAFDNASIANTGGNTPYTVSGDVGSSFTLTGSSGAVAPSGTQVISTSPTTYQIAIGDQSTACGSALRYPQVSIGTIGNTVLASGLSNTDTITQAAGPVNANNNNALTISAVNTVYNTQTVGGQLRWDTGARWTVTIQYTVGIQNAIQNISTRFPNPVSPNQFAVYSTISNSPYTGSTTYTSGSGGSGYNIGYNFGSSNGVDYVNPPSGTYTSDISIGGNVGSQPYVNFNCILIPASGCYTHNVLSVSTGNLYP
jgi:hypothetical protein